MQICEQKPEVHTGIRADVDSAAGFPMRRCEGCSQLMSRPALACVQCHSRDFERVRSPGIGRIVSWRIHHQAVRGKAHPVPIVLAIVALDEGPWICAAIESPVVDDLAGNVRVEFRAESMTGDFPVFAPVTFRGAALDRAA
ncbi:Zn-ribbon domain-containing OB-fold protein [Nocardia higoensis]|uniref:Zn-ribbon domain-containing OB-fold protein n=1 Tax=Nocardia higoensis TaxID=228599 RepID=UPI00068489E0|nr:OB-fold domain-containing protein [Nocardia higoensis]